MSLRMYTRMRGIRSARLQSKEVGRGRWRKIHVQAAHRALNASSFSALGNIQGDSRKFLGHIKRHFGSQISSESSR